MNQRAAGPLTASVSGSMIKSALFTIISTGTSADGKIKRAVKAIIKRNGNKLETVYWNDNWTERQGV
ncbi:MAG: hypothetical protein HY756_10485 [Nitrospirae bacterium]|nr:hypothetical protein [Nitrospirota bacterium]